MCPFIIPGTLCSGTPSLLSVLNDDGDDEDDDDDGNLCSLLVQETNKTSASSGARVSCGIYERTIHALTASTSLPKFGITPLKKKPNK